MLELKIQQVKNELQDVQNAVNLAYYKSEYWGKFLAESPNVSKEDHDLLLDAFQQIIEALEPYRS